MTISLKLIIMILFAASFFSGCRMLPSSETPFLAGEYLLQAEMEGAAEFAPEEYQLLLVEFSRLEKLHQEHQHDVISKQLPLFTMQVDQLIELTRKNISSINALSIAPTTVKTEAVTPAINVIGETAVTTESERITKPRLTYTVSEGELLWAIAKRADVYGDPLLWPLLYQANRDQIKDPRKIYAGQTFSIPRNITEEERETARNLAKKSDFFSP